MKRFVLCCALFGTLVSALEARANDADPWFGRDKAAHFAISAALAAGGYAGGAAISDERWVPFASGTAIALGAGIAKEAWDATGRGDPSWRDFTWDVVGTATGLAVAWLVGRLLDAATERRDAPAQ